MSGVGENHLGYGRLHILLFSGPHARFHIISRWFGQCTLPAFMSALLTGAVLFAGLNMARTDAETVLEHQVKAAMLYKFLSYIDWPPDTFADARSPFRISVLGASSVSRQLRELTENRTVGDRPIEVQNVSTTRQIDDPHLVFVGRHAQKNLPRVARLAERHSFLVVTEKDDGLPPGSTINLRTVEGRVGFDVSLVSAQRAGVKLSARLLSVASTVDQESH